MKNLSHKNLIKAWLYKGKDDLLFAKASFKETEFYDQICCLCQQAVEKCIKAIILTIKREITKEDKIHNLNILAKKCKSLIDLSQFDEELRILSETYIPVRYPNEAHLKAFSKKEAKDSIEMTEKIINFIDERLIKILK
ncbi:HEPN domain-containing protein [Candidatus Kuenenbacteria bacterium]|nr:HEPN domain-containing protein [Candidatus Kuenenbacteria bacterium]